MGFIKQCNQLEAFFARQCGSYQLLSDSEYRKVIKEWRSAFEDSITINADHKAGDKAILALSSRLPLSGYIFNMPGYKFLPVVPLSTDPAYSYRIVDLREIDESLFNKVEAVVCNSSFDYTCVFNHEAQACVAEMFYEL